MKMKAMLKRVLALSFAVGVVCLAAPASADVTTKTLANGFTYINGGDDEPQPGVWDSRYTLVINKAVAEGIPVAVFFAKSSCGRCKRLEANIVASGETFANWAKKRGYMLLFGMLGEGESGKTLSLILKGTALPQCGVWWDKDGDGKPEVGDKKHTSWTGSGATSEVVFMENADKWLGEYSPIPAYAGGTFDFEETEYDRLECEDGTETVSFTLTRGEKESEFASDVTIVAIGPGGVTTNINDVSWEEGESNKTVTVSLSGMNFTEDGQQATIVLTDTNGVAQASNHVTYVEKENSSMNPLWIGERASPKRGLRSPAPNLEFGEWTMDLAAAKALTESTEGDAFTLVMVSGALWCPNCENFEKNFLTLTNEEGEVKFTNWAKKNNVSLAMIDVGSLTGGTVECPTLLSRKTGTSYLSVSRGEQVSGRGYMTRKGISDEEGAAQIEENKRLARTFTADGGFIRPEDTEDPQCNGYRPRVPCFYILRKDGTVAARLSRFTFPTTPTAADQQWFDNYLKRFDEMLAIAGKDDSAHADKAEVENDYAATTAVSIVANGGSVVAELSSADLRDAYLLDKFAGNATISVLVTNEESSAQVELSLWQVKNDGTAAMLTGAYRTGRLSDGVSLEYAIAEAGTYAVQVAAKNRGPTVSYLDDEFSPTNGAPSNFTAYTLTSRAIYTPGPAPGAASAPEGSKTVNIQLETGVLYKLVGLDAESDANAAALELVEGADGFYKALQSGTVALEAATEGGEVTYQKWVPGKVGFEPDATTKKTEVTVSESQDVTVGYRRVDGISGDLTVEVSLNVEETDFYYDYDKDDPENPENSKFLPRFSVNGEYGFESTTVVWADGQSLEECVGSLLVQAADTETQFVKDYFGPGKVVFDIEITKQTDSGEVVAVVDNAKFTINYTDDQKPEAGVAAFVDAVNDAGEGWVKKQTIYAREDGSATLTVARLENSAGPVYATVSKSVSTVTLGGDCEGENNLLFWGNRKSDDKTVTVTNLPAAGKSVKLTLKASALSPELKVLSASNSVTIVSVASDAPSFAEPEYSSTVYRYAFVSNVYPVVCEDGDELSFNKVSGKLPAGLKMSADSAGKAMVITGVPTGKDGAGKDYAAVFQVTAKRGKTKVQGLTTIVGITVKDPAVEGSGVDGAAFNDVCAKTKKLGDAMVFGVAENGETAELVGILTGLTLPATGKASAKFECADGKVSLSAKNWGDAIDDEESADYGQMGVTLVGKGGYSLDVDVARDGKVVATLTKGDDIYEEISFAGTDWSKDNSAKDCMGYYTVTLPVVENPDTTKAIVENREGVASRAAAYLTLTMTKESDANKGLMKWAGLLPNGEKVSGSSTLADLGDGNVYLPYWKFSKKDDFTGVVKIMRGAKDMSATFDGEDDSCYETVFTPMLDFGDGEIPVRSVWRHSENNKATTDGDYEIAYEPYGGIYDASFGLNCCCIDGRGTDEMTLTISQPEMDSDVYGPFAALEPLSVKVGEKTMTLSAGGGTQKLTLKFDSKTGIVSGGFNLSYKDASGKAKTVKATYNGVVQLGFGNACGCSSNSQPFMSGFWTFADKLSYPVAGGKDKTIKVKRGASVKIDVE